VLATGSGNNGPRVVALGLDALWLGFHCEISAEDHERLDLLLGTRTKIPLDWGGESAPRWEVDSGGGQWKKCLLKSEHVTLSVASHHARNNPTITFRFTAHVLWEKGWEACWQWAEEMATSIHDGDRSQITCMLQRADLAVDLVGTNLVELGVQDYLVTRATIAAYSRLGVSTGWVAGKRKRGKLRQIRVYDKTREIRDQSGKTWSHAHWEDVDHKREQVVRVEAECHRSYLDGWQNCEQGKAVDTIAGFRQALPSIWEELVGSDSVLGWCSLREPRHGRRQADRPPCDSWRAVQLADWTVTQGTSDSTLAPCMHRTSLAEDSLPSTLGALTSLAARLGIIDFKELMGYLEQQVVGRTPTWGDRVRAKMITRNPEALLLAPHSPREPRNRLHCYETPDERAERARPEPRSGFPAESPLEPDREFCLNSANPTPVGS